jgi:AraC-like DNA-binding protein
MNDSMTLNYGTEEGLFHMHHVKRIEHFERTNHYHGIYEIYYLLSGQRAYFVKDRSYLILPGDLLFINKFEVHKTSVIGSPEHERIVINFSDAFLNSNNPLHYPELYSTFHHPTSILRLKLQEQIFVKSIMSKLTHELTEKASGFEIYTKLLLTELLLFASRFMAREESQVMEHATPQHRKISEIVRFINQRYAEPITLQHLSKQFYMSPFYLSRVFKEVTGFTFIAYLNSTRMREAQKLLKESNLKIIEIAAAVGIDNVSHFGRTFKQLTGTTPVQYRKNEMI